MTPLDVEERHALLRLARNSIRHGLVHGGAAMGVDPADVSFVLMRPRGAFVTVSTHDGALRGCCGQIETDSPLAEVVSQSACAAAFCDPRFPAVMNEDELNGLAIDVSVLSPLEPMVAASEPALVEQLVPEEDGLVILSGEEQATFLPDVWRHLPDPWRFVERLKRKAGLPGDYWSEDLRFLRYWTDSFSDREHGEDDVG